MTPEQPLALPVALIDRFASACNAFVQAAAAAVAESSTDPALAGLPAFRAWQNKVLPLLQKQNAAIQQTAEQARHGDPSGILPLAADKRGLAKDLDGFPFTFVTPERAAVLASLQTAVVTSAWQLCAAAGIP